MAAPSPSSDVASPKSAKQVTFNAALSAESAPAQLLVSDSSAFFNDTLPESPVISFAGAAKPPAGAAPSAADGDEGSVPGDNSQIFDQSVASHERKAKAMDKSFIDVAVTEESRRLDEFDRTDVALSRSTKFVPVNPFQGDAVELLDPMNDTVMGIDLNEAVVQERERTKAFQQVNHTAVEYRAALGFNFDPAAKGNRCTQICHVDEDLVCYSAGRHVHVSKLLDTTFHRMLQRTPRCIEVMSFTVSSNGKYIAIAERMLEAPHVTVYKLETGTKITSLSFKHLSPSQVVALEFSSNNNFLASMTAPPTQRLIMWQLSDVKVIGVLDEMWIRNHSNPLPNGVTAASAVMAAMRVNPWSSFHVATCSDQGFSVWKLSGRVFTAEVSVSTVVPPPEVASGSGSSGGQREAVTGSRLRPVADVCWYDEHCLGALTVDGYFFAVEHGAIKQRLRLRQAASSQSSSKSPGSLRGSRAIADSPPLVPPMSKLVWASRGMLCSGDEGIVILIDRTFGDPAFVQVAVFRLGSAFGEGIERRFPSVRSVSVSPGETNFVFGLSDNSVVCVTAEQLNDAIADAEEAAYLAPAVDEDSSFVAGDASLVLPQMPPAQYPTSGSVFSNAANDRRGAVVAGCGCVFAEDPPFAHRVEHLSFHSQPVTSISTCVQRSIIATASSDTTLRIYNYETHEVVLAKRLEDEILASALHPTGLFIVLCFRFYSRAYAILPKDLHAVEDINVKPCHEVRFSNTGGRIAFAVNNRVIIYDAHTYRIVGGLVGHMSNVKSISFSPRDEIITTCDVAGIILTWNAATFERNTAESSQKNLIFQQALLHHDTNLFCAVGSSKHARGTTFEGELTLVCSKPGDESIVYVRPGMILPKAQATRRTHYNMLAITKTSSTLIAATPTGRLLFYSWPLLKSSKPYLAVDSHLTEITHILVTEDEKYLFTCSADCTMFVYDLLHMRDGKYVTPIQFNYALFEPVLLRHVTDSDQLERDIYGLRQKIDERKIDNARALENIKRTREADIAARTAVYAAEIERLRRDIERINSAMHSHERVTSSKAAEIESTHAAAAEEIEVLYSKRAREAMARIDKLEAEREELAAQYEAKVASKRHEHTATRNKLEARIAERERSLQAAIADQYRGLKSAVLTQEAMFAQTVADYETQLATEERQHKTALASNDERTQKATTTATFGDREAERLRREIVEIHHEVSTRKERHVDLCAVLHRKDKENKVLKGELLQKQEAINDTENRMLQLKQQLSKLENLRFVLTHQYEELRRAYIPKDGQIRDLELRIRDMETELQSLSFERSQVREFVMSSDARLEEVSGESAALRVRAIDQDRRAKVFLDEIGRLLDTYSDGLALKKQLTAVVAKGYKSTKVNVDAVMEAKAVEAVSNQQKSEALRGNIEYLEAQFGALRRQEKDVDHETVNHNKARIIAHSSMIEEIRTMRDERKDLLTRCNFAEQQLRDACVALHRLSDPRRVGRLDLPRPIPEDMRLPDALPPPPPLLPPIERSASSTALVPTTDTLATIPSRESGAVSAPPTLGTKGGSRSSIKARKGLPNSSNVKKHLSKNAAATAFERTQLQDMIGQLDKNTDIMRGQQAEVNYLRDVVQSLLAAEEGRLMEALRDLMPSSASPTLPADANNVRTNASPGADSFVGPTPGLEDDGVDWSSPQHATGRAPSSRPASVAREGRPMTPTRRLASSALV